MSSLVNPLQGLIDSAALLPKDSGAIKPYSQRMNPQDSSNLSIIFLDISGSMNERVGNFRKIELLRQALNRPLQPREIIIAFHSIALRISDLYSIPEPAGGTALHLAIGEATKLKPRHSLVVSDGQPDDPDQCLAIADKLSGIINTLYIGEDTNTEAIAFMRKLARLGYGRAEVCDIRHPNQQQELSSTIVRLLPPS